MCWGRVIEFEQESALIQHRPQPATKRPVVSFETEPVPEDMLAEVGS